MPVSVQWDDPQHDSQATTKRVLRFDFEGHWNWDEATLALEWADILMQATSGEIAVIMDLSHSRTAPSDALSHVTVNAQRTHPPISHIVAVGTTPFVSVMGEMVRRLYNRYAVTPYYAATVEDARDFIAAAEAQHKLPETTAV